MQRLNSIILSSILAVAVPAGAQVAAPRQTVESGIAAVEALGKQVVFGNHKAAVDSMYPQWKQRMAKRKGGIEKLEAELEGIGAVMARNGISIISFKTEGAPRVYEVWEGAADPGPGNAAPKPVFTKWMMLIPTVTQLRILGNANPQGEVINIKGFQIAIADKGRANWTFINGSDVSIADLRSLFPSLPANMELPEVKRELAE